MGHSDVVDVGERETDAGKDLVALDDALVLATEVSHRLGNAIDEVGVEMAHGSSDV